MAGYREANLDENVIPLYLYIRMNFCVRIGVRGIHVIYDMVDHGLNPGGELSPEGLFELKSRLIFELIDPLSKDLLPTARVRGSLNEDSYLSELTEGWWVLVELSFDFVCSDSHFHLLENSLPRRPQCPSDLLILWH